MNTRCTMYGTGHMQAAGSTCPLTFWQNAKMQTSFKKKSDWLQTRALERSFFDGSITSCGLCEDKVWPHICKLGQNDWV